MDQFPEDINRKQCGEILSNNQIKLTEKVINDFTNDIKQALENCHKNVTLEFDKRLWKKHRIDIAKKLLEKFDEIEIISENNICGLSRNITDPNNITGNLSKILINFVKDEK